MTASRDLWFPPEDMARIRKVCKVLNTSFAEFMEFAVMQSVTELEGYAEEQEAIRRFYER